MEAAQRPTEEDVQEADFQIVVEGDQTEEEMVESPSVALVPHEDHVPRPALPVEELILRREELEDMMEKTLVPSIDYGIIPNTGGKPSLLKPGAEKIAFWFGWEITFPLDRQRRTEDVGEGFFWFTYTCVLVDKRTGREVGECEGSANSKEKRFATYRDGRQRNPFDQINSLMKMGQKRAMVGAILFAGALSNRFTQDVEDMDITGGEPFGLDVVVTFGKHSGSTWKEICDSHRDYVEWCIGRGNGDGMDKLDAAARKVLGEYLDGGGEEKTEARAPDSHDPLHGVVGWGKKHKSHTWYRVLTDDPSYVDWCLKNDKVTGPLAKALTEKLEAALEMEAQAKSDGKTDPPPPSSPPQEPDHVDTLRQEVGETWEDLFTHLMTENKISEVGEQVYAEVHPKLPSILKTWTEDNYQKACRELDRHGVKELIDLAMKRKKEQSTPDEPILPRKIRDLFTSVSERALAVGVIDQEELDKAQALVDHGDEESVVTILDQWQEKVFRKAAKPDS